MRRIEGIEVDNYKMICIRKHIHAMVGGVECFRKYKSFGLLGCLNSPNIMGMCIAKKTAYSKSRFRVKIDRAINAN